MKKFLVVFVVLALLLTISVPALAKRPDTPPGHERRVEKAKIEKEVRFEEQKSKENGAVKYEFFLSGDVMPVPPYGGSDVEGSDERSKLIVNQPNGMNIANVTGVMKGLLPDTEYTVYFSNGYMPYMVSEVWNVVGDYVLHLDYNGTIYSHEISITSQEDGVLTGTGGYPDTGPPYSHEEEITGTLDGNTITLHSLYTTTNAGYVYDVTITIAPDGTMTGTWEADEDGVTDRPLTIAPLALEYITEGSMGWPGLLSEDYLPPFTFTTDEEGHASWHVNIPCEAVNCEDGIEEFSVWINGAAGTVLISETVVLECDCEPAPE